MTIEKAIEFLQANGYKVEKDSPENRNVAGFTLGDIEGMIDQRNEDNDTQIIYSQELGIKVMDYLDYNFDATQGISWETIENAVNEVNK